MIKDKQLKGKIGIEIKQDILENHREAVYLGIGSNIGNRIININNACYLLRDFCSIIKISSIYETSSWPNKNFPKYLNVILKCSTSLDPFSLLSNIKNIEKKLGRKTKKKNFPRTCDIDIIDYNGTIISNKDLTIPHPKTHLRNFVIYPLKEIEPNWIHPIFNKKIDSFFIKLDKSSHNEITRLGKSDIMQL